VVRREGRYPGAELLPGGPRRVLAAPVLDLQPDRKRGRGLVEHEVKRRSGERSRMDWMPASAIAVRDAACHSIYSGKAAAGRAQVVRTLVSHSNESGPIVHEPSAEAREPAGFGSARLARS
jgi:hypothetical protein